MTVQSRFYGRSLEKGYQMLHAADTKVLAQFAYGVFTPQRPVELSDNATVELTLRIVNGAEPKGPVKGSPEAFDAYIAHLKAAQYHFANRWDRDALYDRI